MRRHRSDPSPTPIPVPVVYDPHVCDLVRALTAATDRGEIEWSEVYMGNGQTSFRGHHFEVSLRLWVDYHPFEAPADLIDELKAGVMDAVRGRPDGIVRRALADILTPGAS